MNIAGWVLVIVMGLVLLASLAAAGWLWARLEAARAGRTQYEADLERRIAELTSGFKSTIDASAGRALESALEQFRKGADETFTKHRDAAQAAINEKVQPITEALKKTEQKLGEIEGERKTTFGTLTEQIGNVAKLNEELKKETGNLVAALRKPEVRGRYGEIQLRRVVELAGMRDYCDFTEQESVRDEDSARLRPDMVVRLPNDRCVVIDSKTPLAAYLDAIQAMDDAARDGHLKRFASHVENQVQLLAKKEYWAQFGGSAEFVVMFIPGDQLIDAALQQKPNLLELAAEKRVILASPSTLIGLLRAVYVGWRERNLSDRAQELFELGRELHKRAVVAFTHVEAVGDAIKKAAEKYNDFVGSVGRNMMPTLRKFEDAGIKIEKAVPDLPPLDVTVREFRGLPENAETPTEKEH